MTATITVAEVNAVCAICEAEIAIGDKVYQNDDNTEILYHIDCYEDDSALVAGGEEEEMEEDFRRMKTKSRTRRNSSLRKKKRKKSRVPRNQLKR